MEALLPRSWREEFTLAAAMRREDLLFQERLARAEARYRERAAEIKLAKQRQEQELTSLAAALATPERVIEFRTRLDTHDARTVEALMLNQEARDAVRERIDRMLGEAHVLPDGRRVFKTRDGRQVFDEHGQELSPEAIDPATISDRKPIWEAFRADKEEGARLDAARRELLEYQGKLDAARERLDKGDLTQTELDRLDADLQTAMPEALRSTLKPDRERPEAKQASLAPQAALPDDMDELMRQSGLGKSPAPAP